MEPRLEPVMQAEAGSNLPIVEVISKIPETVWDNIHTLFSGFIEVTTDEEQDENPRFI